MTDPHKELGAFLRRARSERDAHTTGLFPDGRIRRVPGLRREEVAQLAGVSTDYYTRLEQGRHITPSAQVIDALIRALDLDEAAQRYVHQLLDSATVTTPRPRTSAQRLRPELHQLLDSLPSHPVLVLGHRTDILAANPLAKALFADFDAIPARHRNYARWLLLDEHAHTLFIDWEEQARNAVESLRLDAASAPNDPDTQQLVGELSLTSSEFRHWWTQHHVHQRTHGRKRLQHPVVGELTVLFETLAFPGDPHQTLYIYSTETGTSSSEALALLASWSLRDEPGKSITTL